MVRLPGPLQEGLFLHRLNRFAALVEVAGMPVTAHLANSGRLHELLQPGNRVLLAPKEGERKTPFDMVLVDLGGTLVSCDARLPPRVLAEAIREHRCPAFDGYDGIRPEVRYRESRLDLLLSGRQGRCFVETKSVTLVQGGVALFPDAPTERGRRHLESLSQAARNGDRAAVVFVAQRGDATAFAPHWHADPLFGQALQRAMHHGVEAYAYRCHVRLEEIGIAGEIPVQVAPGEPVTWGPWTGGLSE